MRFSLSLLFPLFIATASHGQVITYDDFKAVIPLLQKEDFKSAFKKTSQLLKSTRNDTSDLRGIITYMNIFSAAGMVSLGQMSYDDFSKNANSYIGQYVVMSAHPCIDSSKQGFNSLKFIMNEGQLEGMTVAANANGTSILCFEYFKYAEAINPGDYIGKNVRCGGILQSVEINPNKSMIWISKLHVSDAFARDIAR